MRSHRDRMTLIGAEGITAEGSYTWGNEVALRLRPRGRGPGESTFGAPLLGAEGALNLGSPEKLIFSVFVFARHKNTQIHNEIY